MAYDGIVMSQVVQDISNTIKGGRINKIYQISQYEMLFQVRAQSKNMKLLVSIHPMYARVQLTTLSYPTPQVPNALTMLFRKHLEGAWIESIEQVELDRIIQINLYGRNELQDVKQYHMYIEIMGRHSNMILTNEDNKILECLKRVPPYLSQTRTLQPGGTYQFPPMKDKRNPYLETEADINSIQNVYQGFSPELSREVEYRMKSGQTFQDIMNECAHSESIYIHHENNKETFHIIELKHIGEAINKLPFTQGFDDFYGQKDEKDRIKQQTQDLSRYITNEYDRNINKLEKLKTTLLDNQDSDDLRVKGELLYSHLHLIQKGMSSVDVVNYYNNETLTIDLDPRRGPKENAQRYFHLYQKNKNSIEHLQQQISIVSEELDYFDSLKTMISQASYYDAIEIKEELEIQGYLKKKITKQAKKKKKPHIMKYVTTAGVEIYVGKNNLQNDYLTFKLASKNDTWFHAKDMPGSHVVVHSENLDEFTIRLASKIAAFYSKGRLSSSVPVNYTQIKNLKKPAHGKPGQVILQNYSTIYIDPDDQFLNDINVCIDNCSKD